MSVDTGEQAEAAATDAEPAVAAARLGAVLDAGVGLFTSLRRVAVSLLVLCAAEARVLRASIALVFLASVALVAFAVSLWACVVALLGWALTLATHSIGIALAVLVALHLVLVAAIWLVIRRAVRRAGFPLLRGELRALRGELRGHVQRFQHAAAAPPAREPTP